MSQEVFDCMQRIPPIGPESLRPQGVWVDAEDGDGIVCPACGEDFCVLINETERFKFCPECGAKMKGAETEDLEKYGDVQVVEIRDEREKTEQLSMSGLQKGRYK